MTADGSAASPYEASPYEVHVARLYMGAWGPACQQRLWEVPLIHPEHWEYASCLRCTLIEASDKEAERA